jgi:hypothetical protein
MKQRKTKPVNKNSMRVYLQYVAIVSFVFMFFASVIISSLRLAVGTLVLGVFLGYLIHIGLYTD